MRKMLSIFSLVCAMVFVASATASSGHGQWYHHTLPNEHTVCNQSDTTPNPGDAGPFESKAACEATDEDPPPCPGQSCEPPPCVVDCGPPPCEVDCDPGPDPDPTPHATVVISVRVDHAYLCYSVGGTPYVAKTEETSDALALLTAGYWTASAVAGNVEGGTNVGAYHLVCGTPQAGGSGNAPDATWYVDNNGALLDWHSASSTGFIGVYPLIT